MVSTKGSFNFVSDSYLGRLTPALIREITYSSIRIGGYEPMKLLLDDGTGAGKSLHS